MGSKTAAGSTLAISATAPATNDAAGHAALTHVEIGGPDKLGTFGSTFAKVEWKPLKGATDKHKGSVDYGALQPTIAVDDEDAGQVLLRTAAEDSTSKLYYFKVTLSDGGIRYFAGRVFGSAETVDGVDSILTWAPVIEICDKPIKVDAP